jgi:hypothetical protein
MKISTLSLFLIPLLGATLAWPAEPSHSPLPPPQTQIDSRNLPAFENLLPGALAFAVRHGMKIQIQPTHRIEWPKAYQAATEQHSGQVRIGPNDTIENYVDGLPFPSVAASELKAGVKVAYNWRYGPFEPGDAVLDTTQRTSAYVVDSAEKELLHPDDSDHDFRNENTCDQAFIKRYGNARDSRTNADAAIEWKERGDHCGPYQNSFIGVQYNDPSRPNDFWVYIPAMRKWRRMGLSPGYPNQSCTYTCTQMGWEYAAPKTEVYSYQLLGEAPTLACLENGEGSGIDSSGGYNVRFGKISCEIRNAFVLRMTPKNLASDVISAKVLIDSETYLYLGAEFYRGAAPDLAVPIWNVKQTSGTTVMMMSNDFYVPADRPNILLALNLRPGNLRLNGGEVADSLFTPASR